MGWIDVKLPMDRSSLGRLRLLSDTSATALMTCDVLGKADTLGAAAHGNPTRDPTRPFGDTPAGTYDVTGWAPVDRSNPEEVNAYGPWGKLVMDPTGGPALEAKRNGRYGLLIHGGRLATGQRLRPTYGCLRVADADMERIVTHHRNDPVTRCIVTEVSQPETPEE